MPADLFPELVSSITNRNDGLGSLEDARQEAEKRHILRALALTGGEIIPAAKALGIGRTTLWEKMRRLGLRTDAEGRLTRSE
jgi:transcriptional regulator of acetoin/glycerol metabolism